MKTVDCPECGEPYSAWREECPECAKARAAARPAPRRQDPYRILQVDHRADPEVIEAAYKRLAFKYHPDRNEGVKAYRRMQAINDAYALLKDPEQRRKYDLERGRARRRERRAERAPVVQTNEHEATSARQQSSAGGILLLAGLCAAIAAMISQPWLIVAVLVLCVGWWLLKNHTAGVMRAGGWILKTALVGVALLGVFLWREEKRREDLEAARAEQRADEERERAAEFERMRGAGQEAAASAFEALVASELTACRASKAYCYCLEQAMRQRFAAARIESAQELQVRKAHLLPGAADRRDCAQPSTPARKRAVPSAAAKPPPVDPEVAAAIRPRAASSSAPSRPRPEPVVLEDDAEPPLPRFGSGI